MIKHNIYSNKIFSGKITNEGFLVRANFLKSINNNNNNNNNNLRLNMKKTPPQLSLAKPTIVSIKTSERKTKKRKQSRR